MGKTLLQKVWDLHKVRTLPTGQTQLKVTLAGGTGDADEYVKFGAAPTLTTYDCRPYVSGNTESCPFASPQTGTYYVMVNGYAAYSGVTLKATWTAGGGNTAPTANFTFTTSNLVATFTDTSTNNETCTFNAPTAGTYYVNVRAYAAYSGVSLKGTITP